MKPRSRRAFRATSALAGAGVPLLTRSGRAAVLKTTQVSADGFFTLGTTKNRWFFLTPERKPSFSPGLNDIDPDTQNIALIVAANLEMEKWAGGIGR